MKYGAMTGSSGCMWDIGGFETMGIPGSMQDIDWILGHIQVHHLVCRTLKRFGAKSGTSGSM